MRLTADLIARSDSYFNPLKERELNLRGILHAFCSDVLLFDNGLLGNKIAIIENLGATQVFAVIIMVFGFGGQ